MFQYQGSVNFAYIEKMVLPVIAVSGFNTLIMSSLLINEELSNLHVLFLRIRCYRKADTGNNGGMSVTVVSLLHH